MGDSCGDGGGRLGIEAAGRGIDFEASGTGFTLGVGKGGVDVFGVFNPDDGAGFITARLLHLLA